jgi:hypothetical protein
VATHRGVDPRGVSAGMRAIYCVSIETPPTSMRRHSSRTRRLTVRGAPNMVQCAGRWLCSMGVLKNTEAWCVRVYSKRPGGGRRGGAPAAPPPRGAPWLRRVRKAVCLVLGPRMGGVWVRCLPSRLWVLFMVGQSLAHMLSLCRLAGPPPVWGLV